MVSITLMFSDTDINLYLEAGMPSSQQASKSAGQQASRPANP